MTGGVQQMAGPAAGTTGESRYRWVYLWHLPLRTMHWIAAICIVTLVATGLYIGKPYFLVGDQAESPFVMGWIRFVHFMSAAVLIVAAIIRVYWLFAGDKYERWRALFPFRMIDWVHLYRQIRYYAVFLHEKAPHYLGHNPLQQLSYTALYAVTLIEIVTGLGLYGLSNPAGFFYATFGWVSPLLGGAQVVRFVHHVMTWYFAIFVPLHIYFAVRADVTERDASISSMVSGGRFRRADLTYEDE
jgi:Ni/Fe-hydrogenase 1 B-type cytochrome subunit